MIMLTQNGLKPGIKKWVNAIKHAEHIIETTPDSALLPDKLAGQFSVSTLEFLINQPVPVAHLEALKAALVIRLLVFG